MYVPHLHKGELEWTIYLMTTTCLLHHSCMVFSRKPAWKPLLEAMVTFSRCTANTLEKAVVSATITTKPAKKASQTSKRIYASTGRRGWREKHLWHDTSMLLYTPAQNRHQCISKGARGPSPPYQRVSAYRHSNQHQNILYRDMLQPWRPRPDTGIIQATN